MTSLMAIRDMLALEGRLQAAQISQRTATPLPLVEAMLMRLEAMGRATCVAVEEDGCFSEQCRTCPEGKACQPRWWMLRQ
ncbi:FeoC-like transcriptional regulator [Siccibacter colletis]|uniref:FeoC-like transcriptional regulator n=1 Tax=Siccibacter colletis TaxID=1505757 RepID=UPI0028BEE754|nr:FeoC-like transcriptional regulator [Siccibacter colletis]WNN48800.1 FeoC-like transcriptional regulator [Siccibacter colletis]